MSKVPILNVNDFRVYITNKLKKDYPSSSDKKIKILADFAVECFSMGVTMSGGKLTVNID